MFTTCISTNLKDKVQNQKNQQHKVAGFLLRLKLSMLKITLQNSLRFRLQRCLRLNLRCRHLQKEW